MEKEELRLIYERKGFQGDLLDQIVAKLSENKEIWTQEMVIAELGVAGVEEENEFKSSLIIFFAFIAGAAFPTLPYLFCIPLGVAPQSTFYIATGITVFGLFTAGALKKFVTGVNWFKSGLEMLSVGFFAYLSSYLIGLAIPGVSI